MTDTTNTKDLNLFIGLNFRLRRLTRSLTADHVAAISGKSKVAMYRLETGQSWRITDWFVLCGALGLNPQEAARELQSVLGLYRSGARAPDHMPFPEETI